DRERIKRFNAELLRRGVVKAVNKIYVSLAHTDEDVDATLEVFDQALGALAAGACHGRPHPRRMANRWVALTIVFVTRLSMGYQFQSVASVGPLLVPELGLTWTQLGSLIGLY